MVNIYVKKKAKCDVYVTALLKLGIDSFYNLAWVCD